MVSGNRLHMRAVQRAIEIAEGVFPLASYLEVPPGVVAAWLHGSADVPAAAFLKIVEIIVNRAGPRMHGAIPPALVESFRHRPAANS